MKFGEVPTSSAEGAILAHSLRIRAGVLKKGHLLTAEDIDALRAAGYETIIAARLEPGDVDEDEAARRLAKSIISDRSVTPGTAGTGRVNLFAAERGLLVFADELLDAINQVDEAITVSTIAAFSQVEPGQLVATVKIIPFAVAESVVEHCVHIAEKARGLIRIAGFRPMRTALLQTVLPDFRESLLEKGHMVTEARLAALGIELCQAKVCDHRQAGIEAALEGLRADGCEIAMILGASAITDRRDVIPAAIEAAGGEIIQLGMPVDPGNLTLLARVDGMWVLALPGSARSPRLHGSDWILQRLVAGIPVTSRDIRAMGAGGLLKEIPGRPMPRTQASRPPAPSGDPGHHVAAIVLAAGQSRRMGRRNKLLAEVDGRPMVARTVAAVLASRASGVTVVLGHQAEKVRAALTGFDVKFVDNPEYAEGLSTSLRRGLAALPAETEGALICLGDMPRIPSEEIDRLIASFDPAAGRAICVPTHRGKRGNPVLLGQRFFAEIQEISGDVGARQLIGAYPELVHEVEMDSDAVLIDIDTPEALASLTG